MAKRVGIYDIAREANVSITTVSHALNGKGRLSPTVREQIHLVAKRMGYRVSPQARGLATGRTMTLAVQLGGEPGEELVPGLEYFFGILNAASTTALEKGYGFVIAPAGASLDSLQGLAMDGAIIVDPTGEEALLDYIDGPIVTTGRILEDPETYSWVDNDHVVGTRLILDHFMEIGCSYPALLTTSVQQSYVEDAVVAYLEWCAERGLEPIVEQTSNSPMETDTYLNTSEFLTRYPRADAVLTTLDRMAVSLLLACGRQGISVPGDLAVASVTDTQGLRSANPPITALDLKSAQIGRTALELLVSHIEDAAPVQHRIVHSELMTRRSTKEVILGDYS